MSTPTIPTSKIYSTGTSEKITIDKSIGEIAGGNAYYVSATINTGAGIPSHVYIRPLKTTIEYHITFKIASDTGTEIWIFEGTGSTTTGAHQGITLTPWNMNRNSATGSITFIQGVVTGASGTGSKIYSGFTPNAVATFANSYDAPREFILNNSTTYIIIITGAAGRMNFEANWYEK